LKYIEEMKNERGDDELFQKLIYRVDGSVDKNNQLQVQHETIDKTRQQSLYDEYLHEQTLEGVQLLFFMNENRIQEKNYKATPMALMKNKETRKCGVENPRSKQVCKLSMHGEVLGTYESMNLAANENKTFHASISKCCSHPQKLLSSGGFRWCFGSCLDEVQHRCRWVRVLAELVAKVPVFNDPVRNYEPPPVSSETKKKIAGTMKSFFETDAGKQSKKQAHEKRSATMQKRREETRTSIQEKECKACQKRLPVSMFCKKSAALDGLQPYCKPCMQERKKKSKDMRTQQPVS